MAIRFINGEKVSMHRNEDVKKFSKNPTTYRKIVMHKYLPLS